MTRVTCDECEKEFPIHLREFEHPAHKFKGYVIETYFRCAHCGHKYISYVTDKQARKMQKDIRQLHEQIIKKSYKGLSEENYKKAIDEQYSVLEIMKSELKARMDGLKELVASE
ncbi:hypothetical protein J1P26_20075 [Neobacillus sp. MM2021_6]|uniref:hypothetical protein n=1 Tax=Bacillaceae TaxID=186817 RepID=UPI0014089BEF|nr:MULTISPECIES: hypothetical protein [Bacillaceae]MBO0962007.1 hypothetical protein [Neobacillus sp. MM2021_6]NHC20298.1 hypothetical protein [Bacillus sp. MM2020_4]